MRNYISKINDRNLQRKRESGITTYALISVLFILSYKIFEVYPLVPFRTNFFQVLFILTYTVNILISVLIIHCVYEITLGHLCSIRVIFKSKSDDRFLENALDSSILIIPLVLNGTLYVYSVIHKDIWNWYLILTTGMLLLFQILTTYFSFKERKINKPYEIFEGTGDTGTDKDFASIFVYMLSLVCIIFSLYNIYITNVAFSKLQTMLFGLVTYVIPVLLLKITELRKNDRFTSSLENLEYEINVKDLKDDEIRERLQKNYMGFFLTEWIAYNLKQLEEFNRMIEPKKKSIDNLKNELTSIDEVKYPIEHKGRMGRIVEKECEVRRLTDNFFDSKLKEIELTWRNSNLEQVERRQLASFYNKINGEKNKFKAN